jgi:hypothetical protein
LASITAIELGGDFCALARTNVRGTDVAVSAAELLTPTAFPGVDAFTAALRKSRRALGLARRCRVVLWGLPDGASPTNDAVKAVLAPLTNAGFKAERVVSPCNALAALARVKSPRVEGATCWLAINRGGVAIVVVRPGKQIYSHSFPWDSTVGASGSQAELLQRYSLVSFLTPHVKQAMAEARAQGFPVGVVVTCGNLPDLRSLTMPLIEELDVEVETLDSLEGLTVAPAATDRLSESAAAIRLACAGVIARATRPWDDSKRVAAERTGALLRVAAVLAILAGFGGAYAGYVWWRGATAVPIATTAQARPPQTSVQPPAKSPASAKPPSASPPKPAPVPAPVPASTVTQPPAAGPPATPPQTREAAPPPLPPLLKDPLPRVTAILISTDRRFATVNRGQVIGVGDTLGRRVVVGIDERAIRLRESSGVEVRVGLGGRLLGAGRGGSPRPATPEPGVPRPAAM